MINEKTETKDKGTLILNGKEIEDDDQKPITEFVETPPNLKILID